MSWKIPEHIVPLEAFIIWTHWFIEEKVIAFLASQGESKRKGGFAPKLIDAAVITMEVIGGFK